MASLLTLSVVINVAHAATTTLLGHVVAATPPLVLLVAVEGLLREQRRVARLKTPLTVAEWSADVPSTDERPVADVWPDDALIASARQVSDAAPAMEVQPSVTARQAVTIPRSPTDASVGVILPQGDRLSGPSPSSAPKPSSVPSLLREVFRALDAGEAVTGRICGRLVGCLGVHWSPPPPGAPAGVVEHGVERDPPVVASPTSGGEGTGPDISATAVRAARRRDPGRSSRRFFFRCAGRRHQLGAVLRSQ